MIIDLAQESKEVSEISAGLSHLKQTIKDEKAALKKARRRHKLTQDAQEILQLLAQGVQQEAHKRISKVVSSCLSSVFDNPYQFDIQFERKRGRTEARLRFLRDGLDVDPLTASGGGMVDVAAFALRAACLMLYRPRLARILVLDEPFRFVSAEYQPNVRSMLETLAEDLGIQIIMVTHNEAFETGKVVHL